MEFYQEEISLIRRAVGWIVDLIVVIALAWFVADSFGTQVTISGQSMTPGLNGGDVVLVDRLSYSFTDPKRFDVVVFVREDVRTNVKRVIGLPGETVQIIDGLIYIDGKPLEAEESLCHVSLAGLAEKPVILDEGEYFLLGDNREGSEDSRSASIGNVKRSQIQGRAWFCVLPLLDIGFVK